MSKALSKDDIAKALRNCYIPVQIQTISDNTKYNCYIVNDTTFLSYAEAYFLYSKNKQMSRFHSMLCNRFVSWAIIKLYNLFVHTTSYPEYLIVPTAEPLEEPAEEATEIADAQ